MESRVSAKHPGYNEDAALGDVDRIKRELTKPPEIKTSNWDADLEAVQKAGETELKHADALRDRGVFGIADGVSGSKGEGAGLVASRLAMGKAAEIMSYMPKDATAQRALPSIESAIKQAHQAVLEHRQGRPDIKEAATTMDLIKTVDNGDGTFDVAYGHVGDSRIYVFNGETGKLEAKTMDDSLATLFLKGGEITMQGQTVNIQPRINREQYDKIVQAGSADELPDDLKTYYKQRNIVTNAVGMDAPDIKVQTGVFKVKKGDRVIVTSDGIHDNLTDAQIEDILKKGGGMKELAEAARNVAESGTGRAKMDDISGTEVKFGERRPSGEYPATKAPGMSAEQRAQTERAVQDAGVEVALLEDLKRVAQESDRTMREGKAMAGVSMKDLERVRQYGGIEGIDERIRDIKIFSLSHEYQLLQADATARQREAGLDPAQAEKDLQTQKDVVEWQKQVMEAARMQASGGRIGAQRGVSVDAVRFVGERVKAGMSPAEVQRQAETLKADAERKIGLLGEATRDAARMNEIAGEWRNLAAEKQAAHAQREQRRMSEAQRGLGAAYGGGETRPAAQPEAQQQQQQQQQQQSSAKKKPWWKVWG